MTLPSLATLRALPIRDFDLAVGMVVVSCILLPGSDSMAKALSGEVASGFISLFRMAIQVVVLIPFLRWSQLPRGARAWAPHAVRGLLTSVAQVLFLTSLTFMPLADTLAMFMAQPLILTVLSAVVLGESVGWRRYSAVAVGLIGALLVIQPSFDQFGAAALMPAGAGTCFAFYLLMTRAVPQQTGLVVIQMSSSLFAVLFLALGLGAAHLLDLADAAPAMLAAHPMEPWHLAVLCAIGVLNTLAHALMVYAFRLVEAGVLAPFQYSELLFATIMGVVVFGDWPTVLTWLGMTIVTAAGIYVIHRERRLSAPVSPVGRAGPATDAGP